MKERLDEYQRRMLFRANEVAELLNIPIERYRSYRRVGQDISPSFKSAVDYTNRMMVSLDWLAGRDVPMWSASLWAPYAAELQKRLQGTPSNIITFPERVGHVIRALHTIDPQRFDALFISGIIRLKRDDIETILGGGVVTLKDDTSAILTEQFGLLRKWLHSGVGPVA